MLGCGEVVTAGSDGAVMVWDRLDGSLLADLPSSQQPITCLAATRDDATLVTAGEDSVVRVRCFSCMSVCLFIVLLMCVGSEV